MWYRESKKKYTGVMIALFFPEKEAKQLAKIAKNLPDPEDAEQMHITLCFLGDSTDMDETQRELIEKSLDRFVTRAGKHYGPGEPKELEGHVSGTGRFINGDSHAYYASFDCVSLNEFREELLESLRADGIKVSLNHGFTPHCTLSYIPKDEPTPDVKMEEIPVSFDSITLAWGGDYKEYRLKS